MEEKIVTELFVTVLGGVIGGLVTVAGVFIAWKLNSKHAMRMAVFEERFQAHQQAYLWLSRLTNDLSNKENREKTMNTISDALDWWLSNNLYLDEPARSSVAYGLMTALMTISNRAGVNKEIVNMLSEMFPKGWSKSQQKLLEADREMKGKTRTEMNDIAEKMHSELLKKAIKAVEQAVALPPLNQSKESWFARIQRSFR